VELFDVWCLFDVDWPAVVVPLVVDVPALVVPVVLAVDVALGVCFADVDVPVFALQVVGRTLVVSLAAPAGVFVVGVPALVVPVAL